MISTFCSATIGTAATWSGADRSSPVYVCTSIVFGRFRVDRNRRFVLVRFSFRFPYRTAKDILFLR